VVSALGCSASTCRFGTRCVGPPLGALNVQKTIDGRAGTLLVVEIGQGGAGARAPAGPSAGGIGGGGIRLLNAAASKSSPLRKWRYKVALATFALRVTASTVTALGPPAHSNAAAASSKRARDRAGRGPVVPPVMVCHLSVSKQNYRSTCRTIGFESPYAAGGERASHGRNPGPARPDRRGRRARGCGDRGGTRSRLERSPEPGRTRRGRDHRRGVRRGRPPEEPPTRST
jgi:hypothetical protein